MLTAPGIDLFTIPLPIGAVVCSIAFLALRISSVELIPELDTLSFASDTLSMSHQIPRCVIPGVAVLAARLAECAVWRKVVAVMLRDGS